MAAARSGGWGKVTEVAIPPIPLLERFSLYFRFESYYSSPRYVITKSDMPIFLKGFRDKDYRQLSISVNLGIFIIENMRKSMVFSLNQMV